MERRRRKDKGKKQYTTCCHMMVCGYLFVAWRESILSLFSLSLSLSCCSMEKAVSHYYLSSMTLLTVHV